MGWSGGALSSLDSDAKSRFRLVSEREMPRSAAALTFACDVFFANAPASTGRFLFAVDAAGWTWSYLPWVMRRYITATSVVFVLDSLAAETALESWNQNACALAISSALGGHMSRRVDFGGPTRKPGWREDPQVA